MRKIITLVILVSSLTTTIKAQSSDEKAVAAIVETFRQAMINGNTSELERLTASELSYGHSSGVIEDKTAFVESLATGKSDFVTINLTDQTIKIANDVALVRHKLFGEINDGNKANTVKLGVLLIWQKQKGEWKLLARQAFKL